MYRFTGPTPERDGSLDSDVVFHELAHGLSLRLEYTGNVDTTKSFLVEHLKPLSAITIPNSWRGE